MLGLFKPYEYIMESRCKQERLNACCMTSAIALMQERETQYVNLQLCNVAKNHKETRSTLNG